MANEFDIAKIITVSSAHITEDTAQMLDNEPNTDKLNISVYNKADYGWFIYIPEYLKERVGQGTDLPEDLQRCLKTAIDNNCEWLCIDCDGPEIDGLEKYSW